jgi:uncharacterized protein YecE (DUF72 family)
VPDGSAGSRVSLGFVTLYIGTSGWAYKEWKPDFYPADLPQTRFLEHYSSRLDACEINATFYRMQKPETITKWAQSSPEDFRFSLKAHRRLTHSRSIAPDERALALLDAFVNNARGLGSRLGTLLFQFPPHRQRDDAALDALLEAIPDGVSCAFEFRNESWRSSEVEARIVKAEGTVCLSNSDGTVPDALPDGPFAYVRLRTDRYDEAARDGWARLLDKTGQDRDVYAFTKHEGIPADDPFGGIGLACWLVDNKG